MKEIVYTIKVKQDDGTEKEIQKTAKSVNEYGEAIKQLQDKLDNTDLGSKQYQDVQKELKSAQKTFENTKIKAQSFNDTMKSAPGVLGQAANSVGGLSTAFKALLANPVALVITAIVAAVTALVNAFKSTKEGTEFFQRATAGISAAMDVLRDILVVVGKRLVSVFSDPKQAIIDFANLIKQNIINRFEGLLELVPSLGKAIGELFKGNFSKAGKVAADAVAKVTLGVENFTDKVSDATEVVGEYFKEAVREGNEAARLTGVLQKLDDKQRSLNERRAEQNKLIAEAKLKINDETLSYDERIKALEQVSAAEQKLLNDELELEKQRLKAMEALADQSDSDAATLDAISQQRIKLSNLELASFQKSKEVFDQTKALRDRQTAEQTAAAEKKKAEDEQAVKDAEEAAAKELDIKKRKLDAEIQLIEMSDERDIELLKEKLTQKMELELQNLELTEEEKNLIRAQYAEKEKEIDREVTDAKIKSSEEAIAQKQKELAIIANSLGTLSDVLGKETKAGKAAASAQALINTYLGASQVISDKTLPTLVKFVSVAAIIASGLKQVRDINKVNTEVPKYADGGLVNGLGTGTSDSVFARLSNGESVINARSTAQFSGLLSTINQAGGGAPIGNNTEQPIIKAYVVSSEVQSQAQMDRVIKSRSKI